MATQTRTEHEWAGAIRYYEGLVRKTAARYVAFVEEDFDDICAIFRVKIWRALIAFDPERSGMTQDDYVFMCVKNQGKDLVKRRKRDEAFISDERDQGTDAFDARYLQRASDDVYGRIEDGVLLLPSTLTETERFVLGLLYLDYSQKEAILLLRLSKREMERAVRAIREKMADWRPSVSESVVVALDALPAAPLPPLPHAAAA